MPGSDIKFTPIPELEFVREPNLRHLLRAMRSNIRAAYGLDGGGFATKAELAKATSGRAKASRAGATSLGGGAAVHLISCGYDASTGVGGGGAHYLNGILPARAILIRAFHIVVESFAGSGGTTLALLAGDGEEEIVIFPNSALDPAWSKGYHASNNIGQSASGRARAFKAVVSGGTISAGRLLFFAEYVVAS